MNLPEIQNIFPKNTRSAVRFFWAMYWVWFFLYLPWMLIRQAAIFAYQFSSILFTWNRDFEFLEGRLRIHFLNSLRSFFVTAVFGERFTAIAYGDILIDPGPLFSTKRLAAVLSRFKVNAIVATHAHEEHTGNVSFAAERTQAPIYGSVSTLSAIASPEALSAPRRYFIGQPVPAATGDMRPLPSLLETDLTTLKVLESPGHCDGHTSLFDAERGILFAGDSFLHTVFTSPNREVRAQEWIKTLREYLNLPIRTMVGTHGHIFSVDSKVPARPFLVKRRDPLKLIRDKMEFLVWARRVVKEGEQRGLSYRVIEACLFPWYRSWSWKNWFTDEGGRLFSAGEFSRTYFLRSLSDTPHLVPARFPLFSRMAK